MQVYVIKQGDCIGSVAGETGFFWQTIWDDAANAELKGRRGNPFALLAGDRLTIPEKTAKQVPCATGKLHVFRRRGVPAQLKFVVLDREGNPRASIPYTLEVDETSVDGTTGPDGAIAAPIPTNARAAALILRPAGAAEERYSFQLGYLDPVDQPAGIQARLKNAGFYTGAISGVLDDATAAAVAKFQHAAGLTVTGTADEATLRALAERHGS